MKISSALFWSRWLADQIDMYRLAVLNTHPIQYFAPLYRHLADEPGIDLTVYFCSRQGAEEYVDEGFGRRIKWDTPLLEGYKHKFLPNMRQRGEVNGFFSLINPAIIRELRRNRYDALLVHGHNHFTFTLAIAAARLLRIPVMMRCETHLGLKRHQWKRALRKPLMSLLYQHICAACLPIGTRNREFYSIHGVNDERLFTVPYTVDNNYFKRAAEQFSHKIKEVKSELGLPFDRPLILFASKLMPRKRPMDLLLAYQQVRRQDVDAALLYVGSGEQEKLLKDYVKEHDVPEVHFFGFRNQSELPKFYAAADLFILPSENEPWGLILNEVMCAGLPVIASEEIGAVADLVRHGENGFTFPSGDVNQLASHLHKLLSDSTLRKRMSENSRAIIARWNYERCAEGLLSALKHIKDEREGNNA